jgi:tRNA (guanine10-N2)-dimethyltransferase
MINFSYIYSFNYDYHHNELCKLESRQIFDKEEKDKLLFSNIKIDPSISSFIKNRFEVILSSESYPELLKKVTNENIRVHGFKVEYLVLDGDSPERIERRKKLKDVGYCIEAEPNFNNPSITYAICNYKNVWYFGILTKKDNGWQKHKKKPCSFSNSICMNIAKTLVSIASKGNKTNKLLDACCGVGTVILEASFAGFNIEGCDINLKAIKHTEQNLAHYNYTSNVYCSDIKDLNKKYDAAIIDLPYNLYSYSDDSITSNIIESTAKLTTRIVIVSISDIEDVIKKSKLKINDFCTVEKKGRSTFARKIWVCEKENNVN